MAYDFAIRTADLADAVDLASIAYVAWESGILPLMPERPGMKRAEQQRLFGYVQGALGQIIVAESRGEVVGWCSRAPQRAYIPYLFVAPHAQNRGFGSRLLERMESFMELEGRERVQLETPADHVRAVRFYERQGYHILAMRAEGPRAHESLMSVRLEKRLRPFKGPVGE